MNHSTQHDVYQIADKQKTPQFHFHPNFTYENFFLSGKQLKPWKPAPIAEAWEHDREHQNIVGYGLLLNHGYQKKHVKQLLIIGR